MATPRKTDWEKAYTRALKLEVGVLLEPAGTSDRRQRAASEAWQRAAELHGPCDGPGLCEWCDRWPPNLR